MLDINIKAKYNDSIINIRIKANEQGRDEKNKIRGEEVEISSEDSRVKVYVVPTNEELMIARETMNIVNKN